MKESGAAASGIPWAGIGDGIISAGMAAMAGTYRLGTTAGCPHMAQDYRIMSLLDSRAERPTEVSASRQQAVSAWPRHFDARLRRALVLEHGPTLGWSLASVNPWLELKTTQF